MKSFVAMTAAMVGMVVGCGGSVDSGGSGQGQTNAPPTAPPAPADPGTGGASATPAPLDHGAPSQQYPAFTPEIGQLVDNGGSVLSAPVVTTVTWPGEPNAATFEQFGDELGPSAYWKTVTAEYGVGPATSGDGNHVRLTDAPPTTISDTDIPTFLSDHLTAQGSTWPAATPNSVYIFYIPTGTTLNVQGQSACDQGIGGYHDSTTIAGHDVAYAVIPQCGSLGETTLSASHELAEASTDPYPQTRPAWSGFDDNHLAWEFFQQFQSEDGDACEFYRDSTMQDSTLGFTVQRQWSNTSAQAGHDPCVPAPSGAYFNVTPLAEESIDLDLSALGAGTATTKGFKIKVGETKQIPLGFYSDGATGPWTIRAAEGGIMGTSQKGRLTLSLDVTSGQNGQKAYLTVKVNVQGRTKGELVTIVSDDGTTKHYMPIMIGSPDK